MIKKYEVIINDIKAKINNGILKPGDRIMTEYEMIRYYNVSRITVQHAMMQLVGMGVVSRVQGKGSFIAVNRGNLISGKNFIALVIVNSVKELIKIVEGVEHTLNKYGTDISIYISNGDVQHERDVCDKAIAGGAKGIVIFPISEKSNSEYFCELVYRNYPIVFIDRALELCPCDFVATDSFMGMLQLTQHIIDCGHKKIAYLTSSGYSVLEDRLNGFLYGVKKNRLSDREQVIYPIRKELVSMDSDPGEVYAAVDEILAMPQPPTAFIGCNDIIAINCMKQLRRRGFAVPEEFSVSGFDNSEHAKKNYYSLTSVEQDFHSLGQVAAGILIDKINGSSRYIRKYYIPPKLIVRDSVAKRGGGAACILRAPLTCLPQRVGAARREAFPIHPACPAAPRPPAGFPDTPPH